MHRGEYKSLGEGKHGSVARTQQTLTMDSRRDHQGTDVETPTGVPTGSFFLF